MKERLKLLSEKCVLTHTPADIIRHFREELNELNVAFDLFDKGKISFRELLEEVCDVTIEAETFKLLVESKFPKHLEGLTYEYILKAKMDKFEAMLMAENAAMVKGELEFPVNRYKKAMV